MSMVSHASPRTARWLVLSAATLACVGTPNGHSFGWACLLPSIRAELEIGSATIAVCWAVATIGAAPLMVFAGRAVARFGALRTFLVVWPLFCAAIAAASQIRSAGELLAAMFALRLLGPGTICGVILNTIIGNFFDADRRGLASMLMAAALYTCFFLQAAVAALVDACGWRRTMQLCGGLWLVVLGLSAALLRDRPEREARATDVELNELKPAAEAAPAAGLTRADALRSGMFWAVLCAHCSIELVWVGSNLHILDLLGERGLTTAQTALAQSVGAVTAMAVTVVAGLGIDRLPGASKRWVLVGACACGAGALAALRACTGVALGAAYSSLLGAMMGPLDVAHGTLYAALFGTRELPQILGVVSAVTMACVGASPLLFGIAHERTGSFDAVTTPLLALLAVAAAVLAAARPPR